MRCADLKKLENYIYNYLYTNNFVDIRDGARYEKLKTRRIHKHETY